MWLPLSGKLRHELSAGASGYAVNRPWPTERLKVRGYCWVVVKTPTDKFAPATGLDHKAFDHWNDFGCSGHGEAAGRCHEVHLHVDDEECGARRRGHS
jgi:hypothetical protein